MSGLGTKHLIEQQIPSHIREASPLFTKFLQYYYEFNEQLNIQRAIQDILDYNNCDIAEMEFVKSFFEELQILPHNIVADRRLVAKHIYDLYQSKGSEKAVKLLFKIVFGENVDIKYPSEQILRASDGKWIRENVITVNRVSGNISDTTNIITFIGDRGTFSFEIKSIEHLDTNVDRITFTHSLPYYIDGVITVRLYSNDELDYVGTIIPMVSNVVIEYPGKYWQVGQVIILPGIKDTILQITRVGSGGTIVKFNIVQFGYGQSAGTIYILSPFSYKPSGEYVEQYSEKLSNGSYSHTINIFEYMNGYAESILGLDSNQTYVLEGYVLPDHIAFSTILNSMVLRTDPINDDHITIEQWLESRARFRIETASIAIKPGYYMNQDGMLSVPEIRLQDNFYYQIFSYVIETGQMLKTYASSLKMVHPAGFKYFGNMTKILDIDTGISIDRILSKENLLITDSMGVNDQIESRQSLHSINTSMIVDDIDLSNTYDLNDNIDAYGTDLDYDELIESYYGIEYYTREDNVQRFINASIADTFQIIEFENSGSYDANNYPPILGIDDYDIADGTDNQYTQEGPAVVITLNN